MPIAAKSVHLFSTYRVPNFGNTRTNGPVDYIMIDAHCVTTTHKDTTKVKTQK